MVGALIAILPSLLSIIGLILKESYSEKGKEKRKQYEDNKAIAKGDSKQLSARLSNLFDSLRK